MENIGIDVSSYQGTMCWRKVKASGISFAILKIIRKDLNPDKKFETNWKCCEEAGVEIKGVYNYSYATTVEKAKIDAKKVLEILNGRKTTVWLDVEDSCQKNLGRNLINIINAYAEVIKSAGLEFGVYTGQSFYNSYIKPYGGIDYPLWIARYGTNDGTMKEKYRPQINGMVAWQYTSKGSVDGVSGDVDMNVWLAKESAVETENTTSDKVKEWQRAALLDGFTLPKSGIDGKWGSECESVAKKSIVKKRITGYKYPYLTRIVQNAVGVTSDGKCGKATKEAIIAYQKIMGLTADGCVGLDTWKKILEI